MSDGSSDIKPPALDPRALPERISCMYPSPFKEAVLGRAKRALGDALGLRHFGVNLVRLPPGLWSSQRHWHANEDELVYVLEGEVVLVTDAGEQVLRAGMVAGFPAGRPDGHHLINRSDRDALYLEIGNRAEEDHAVFPDVDMEIRRKGGAVALLHKDGTPY